MVRVLQFHEVPCAKCALYQCGSRFGLQEGREPAVWAGASQKGSWAKRPRGGLDSGLAAGARSLHPAGPGRVRLGQALCLAKAERACGSDLSGAGPDTAARCFGDAGTLGIGPLNTPEL